MPATEGSDGLARRTSADDGRRRGGWFGGEQGGSPGGRPGGGTSPRGRRPRRLKDRLFTGLCVLGAVAVAFFALSRGNPRAAAIGAGLFLGYAVLHGVVRRIEPAARVVSGLGADERERLVHYRAIRTAGQTALAIAAVGIAMSLFARWDTGLWVAGSAMAVLAAFVISLWFFGRER